MSRHAERMTEVLAGTTSRRGFLGRLTKLAGGAAAGVAGVLAASAVRAAKPPQMKMCCGYLPRNQPVIIYRCVNGDKCPKSWRGARLHTSGPVSDCAYC